MTPHADTWQARRILRGLYKGEAVLQLRNPWGAHFWRGRWSETSEEFIACKAELTDDGVEDAGMFWMGW